MSSRRLNYSVHLHQKDDGRILYLPSSTTALVLRCFLFNVLAFVVVEVVVSGVALLLEGSGAPPDDPNGARELRRNPVEFEEGPAPEDCMAVFLGECLSIVSKLSDNCQRSDCT